MSRSSTTSGTATQTQKATQTTAPAQPKMTQSTIPLEKVAARAYEKWLGKGCKHGNDTQDWLEAEAELKAELARNGAKK